MTEKPATYKTHLPVIGRGVSFLSEPNITRYTTMTPENAQRFIKDIPMPIGEDLMVPIPTILEKRFPITNITYEVTDDIDKLRLKDGDVPIGGFEQRTFKTLDSKVAGLHINIPAQMGKEEQSILEQRIMTALPCERKEEVSHLASQLPKVSYHQDKGLMLVLAGEPLLSLTPYGARINKQLIDDPSDIKLNFHELEVNQKPFPFSDGFFFEQDFHQQEAPFVDVNGNKKTMYIIVGVKFPKSVDFNYINTYIKTYLAIGGKLTDELIRKELVDPYLHILLKDIEHQND